jgi:CRP-like cAMP-binding protein
LLATLSGPVAAQLAKLGTRRPFAASEVLLREGELSTHVYLLLAGLVKVTATTPEGGFALLAIRVAGDLARVSDDQRVQLMIMSRRNVSVLVTRVVSA